MKKSAPMVAYDFGNKRNYRRRIWGWLSEELRRKHDAQVLLLPSKQGDEIKLAVSRGFRECNIHAVDRNPALLATAPWRKRYPLVNVYGSELPRACERIKAKGIRLDALNLDLCGAISSETTISTLEGVLKSGVCRQPVSYLAITMLSGRDTPVRLDDMLARYQISQEIRNERWWEYSAEARKSFSYMRRPDWEALAVTDRARIERAIGMCVEFFCFDGKSKFSLEPELRRFSRYRSSAGTQYMLWLGMKLNWAPQEEFVRENLSDLPELEELLEELKLKP